MGSHLSCMHAGSSSANRDAIYNRTSAAVLKVVLACEGRIYALSEPVKVAELMLEFPNHFVAEFVHDGMEAGTAAAAAAAMPLYSKRISPLPADHDAQLSHVYLLLPMHRLNTRLSADELSLISALAETPAAAIMPSSVAKAMTHTSSKVMPLSARHYQEAGTAATSNGGTCASGSSNVCIAKSYSVPILELLEMVSSMEQSEASVSDKNANQQLHILRSRSWTPKLETIIESSQLTYL